MDRFAACKKQINKRNRSRKGNLVQDLLNSFVLVKKCRLDPDHAPQPPSKPHPLPHRQCEQDVETQLLCSICEGDFQVRPCSGREIDIFSDLLGVCKWSSTLTLSSSSSPNWNKALLNNICILCSSTMEKLVKLRKQVDDISTCFRTAFGIQFRKKDGLDLANNVNLYPEVVVVVPKIEIESDDDDELFDTQTVDLSHAMSDNILVDCKSETEENDEDLNDQLWTPNSNFNEDLEISADELDTDEGALTTAELEAEIVQLDEQSPVPEQIIDEDDVMTVVTTPPRNEKRKRDVTRSRSTSLSPTRSENVRKRLKIRRRIKVRPVKNSMEVEVENFDCKTCTKKFSTLRQLRKHVPVHSRPFICEICGRGFSHSTGIKYHLSTHTDKPKTIPKKANRFIAPQDKPISCKVCGKRFADKSGMYRHLKVTHKGFRYRCDVASCPKNFASLQMLKNHKIKNHQDPSVDASGENGLVKPTPRKSTTKAKQSDKGTHPCDICPRTLVGKNNLGRHIELKHFPNKKSCPYGCSDKIETDEEWRLHLEKCKSEKMTERSKCYCFFCRDIFPNHLLKIAHHLRHHTSYLCEFCPRTFTRRDILAQHIYEHEEARPWLCTKCGKRFRQEYNLSIHSTTVCGDDEAAKQELIAKRRELHRIYREKAKPHKCNLCRKAFVEERRLEDHKRKIHLNKKKKMTKKKKNLNFSDTENDDEDEDDKTDTTDEVLTNHK